MPKYKAYLKDKVPVVFDQETVLDFIFSADTDEMAISVISLCMQMVAKKKPDVYHFIRLVRLGDGSIDTVVIHTSQELLSVNDAEVCKLLSVLEVCIPLIHSS